MPSSVMRDEGTHLVFDFRQAEGEGVAYRYPLVIQRCPRCGQLGERHDANGHRRRSGHDYVHVMRCERSGGDQRALQRCFVPETGFPKVGDVFEDVDKEGDVARDLEVVSIQDEQESWRQLGELVGVRWAKVKNLATGRTTKMDGWRLVEESRFLKMERKDEEAAVVDSTHETA